MKRLSKKPVVNVDKTIKADAACIQGIAWTEGGNVIVTLHFCELNATANILLHPAAVFDLADGVKRLRDHHTASRRLN